MVGELLKRLVNGVVVLLAALTFFLVPVGRKTPAQHLVAIFTTPPAREAAQAFSDAAKRIVARAADEARRSGALEAAGLQTTRPLEPAPAR